MAADQRKRRLSSSNSALGYGFQEQYKAKRRELKSLKNDFHFNNHVSLKWDDNGKRVVAKEDQIGVSWRHLAPFIASAPCSNAKLADVVTVPRDVFDLKDLSEVLSNEVWYSVLSEKERSFLSQFLPNGVDADEVVQSLLSGDNFHFGNPFLKWGSSLCSGDLHPDAILQHEKSFKTNKKAYYSELQQYHDYMIINLQEIKHRCLSSKDPEAEIFQFMSRSKRHEMNFPSDANRAKFHKPDEHVAALSGSPSSIADEKVYYSDNQKLSAIRDAEIQKRIHSQSLMKNKREKLVVPNGLKVSSRPKKAEKVQKPNLTPNDGAKYMSYVKISKKQHELVKNMRQSGSSIQSKALNRLLGSLDSSNVKPYEMFVEEEKKRIHEFWLKLANKDLPAAFQTWRDRQLEKRRIMDSLWKEMEEKLGFQSKDENMVNPSDEEPAPAHDEDTETSQGTSEGNQGDQSTSHNSSSGNDEGESDTSLRNESPLQNPPNVNEECDPSSSMVEAPLQDPPSNDNAVNEELDPSSSIETQSLQNPPLNVDEEFDPSSSVETESLQNPPQNFNKQFDQPYLMETQSLQNPSLNSNELFDPSVTKEKQPMQHPLKVNEEFNASCVENQSLQHPLNVNENFDLSPVENKSSLDRSPLNTNEDFTPMDLNAENNPVTSETSDICSMSEQHGAQTSEASINVSHLGTCTPASVSNAEELHGSSLKNMWTSIGLPDSFHTHPTSLPSSSGGLFRHHQVVTEQPAPLIDLESAVPQEDSTKDLLNRHTSHMPFLTSYPNRDRNELLHSLIKRDSLHQEQKSLGSEFHPTNALLESANQFPSHFREQLQPPFALDHHHRQKAAQSELLMHQSVPESIYSDSNRYSSIQGSEHFSSLNARDWSNARVSTPVQPSQLSSGELLNHNWFPTENRAHSGWSTSDSTVFPSSSLSSGSNSDQSLYSVLTQCNMRSRAPYNPVVSTESMIPPTNYGQEMAVGIPMTSNALPQTISPFNYLSGGEASTTLKNPNMGWMSLGQQPSTLHDPSGKPYLKSWNQ